MAEIEGALEWLLGLGLEAKDLGVGQMSARAVIVFVLAVFMLRVGDKRFMGKSTAFDVMLGIVYGSTVSRAITGNAPFFPTLAAAFTLVLVHWAMAAVAFRSHAFGTAVKGREQELVRDGEMLREEMRRTHITEHDLHEALRSNGKPPDVSTLRSAHLERNGDVSVVTKDGGAQAGHS